MAELISARCFTNLDEYRREKWPSKFVAIPRIGDRIEAKSGKVLKVVSITHKMDEQKAMETSRGATYVSVPYIKIELHRGGIHD